jgi:hypothetical protein
MQNIESTATPADKQGHLDALCNFYQNTSGGIEHVPLMLQALRDVGYQVKVNHYRYTPQQVANLRKLKMTRHEADLTPTHELRATFDMQVEAGGSSKVNYISSHGGKTEVSIIEPGSTEEIMCESTCSINDQFRRRTGILTGLGRCFHKLCDKYGFTKSDVMNAIEQFQYGTEPKPDVPSAAAELLNTVV